MASDHRINVFFYGSYMNFDVLTNMGISQREYQVCQLPGYALTIGSTANVVKNGLARVFGIITALTHAELDMLYGVEAQAKLGTEYMPEPVLVMTANGTLLPSLCYISYEAMTGSPSASYIKTIISALQEYDVPQSYIQHIESFV